MYQNAYILIRSFVIICNINLTLRGLDVFTIFFFSDMLSSLSLSNKESGSKPSSNT